MAPKLGAPPRARAAQLPLHLSPSSSAFLIRVVLGCLRLVLPHPPGALESTRRDPRQRFQGSSSPALHGACTANPLPRLTQVCKRHPHAHAALLFPLVSSASPTSLVRLTARHLSSSRMMEGEWHCAPWARQSVSALRMPKTFPYQAGR